MTQPAKKWRVEILPPAAKALKKLDHPIRRAADAFFCRLESLEDPRSIGHALTGPLSDFWTYRIHGDWRAIANIQDGTLTIAIVKIAPRGSVYA